MKRYWINPNYKIREEYWGSLAYFLEDITWEIGKDATDILKSCNGKTFEEIVKLSNLDIKSVQTFLNVAKKNNLLLVNEPKKIGKVIERDYKEEFCLTSPMGIFFEITNNCNMQCRHCYTSSNENEHHSKERKELTTKEIFNLIDQASKMGVFVFSIGGGEPLIRKDIIKILEYGIKKDLEMIPVTNGFFLNEVIVKEMKRIGLRQVVVSLDGSTEEIYTKIRGNNIFKQVTNNIQLLSKNGIRVLINVVVTKVNLYDLENIILVSKKLNARAIRFIRLTPSGRAKDNTDLWLNEKEYMYFVEKLSQLSKQHTRSGFTVLKDEAFLGLFSNQQIEKRMSWLPEKYCGCPAGRSFIFIDPYGDVYPCGYLEFKEFLLGNIKEIKLEDIWQNKTHNQTLDFFRKMKNLNSYCDSCKNKIMCQGGCRGTAYLKSNDLCAPDALCFRKIIEKNNLNLRKINKTDAKETSALIIKNIQEVNSKDYPQDITESLVEDYKPARIEERMKEGYMLVVESGGKIVGVGRLCGAEIFDIFVLPVFHTQGIGSIIMDKLEKTAIDNGLKQVFLPASKTAIGFYKKRGYKFKKEYKASKSSHWMVKDLLN